MKGRPVEELVYECMFPKPKPSDPQNFHGLLQRHLVPEVRLETSTFYGSLDSQEAQYPGLDYSYPPHRVRLGRFSWHRRLFRAFDSLKLTPSEIATLTKWEGTKWAKERFEKDQGIKIRDTTGDGIVDWVPPEKRLPALQDKIQPNFTAEDRGETAQDDEEEEWDDDEDSDIDVGESIGLDLNERLRAAVARREAGESSIVMDEEWEQWLKEAAESGTITFMSDRARENATRSSNDGNTGGESMSQQPVPQHYLRAARLGLWHTIPDHLHNRVRQIERHMSSRNLSSTPRQTSPMPSRADDSSFAPGSSTSRLRPMATLRPATLSISSQTYDPDLNWSEIVRDGQVSYTRPQIRLPAAPRS